MAMSMTSQPHRKPPPFPSSHHTPSVSFSSLSSLYKDCTTYQDPTRSFTAFEPMSSVQSDLLSNNNTTLATNSSLIHTPEALVNYMQYYPVKENFLMFGSESSCTSSDGSSGHISFGREMKQENMSYFQGFCATNGYEDNHNFMLNPGTNNGGKNVNQWAEKPREYNLENDLEDFKRLISSSSNNCCNNNFIDENKTQEKIMYFYY
ncbi:hypothetical protein Gorai_011601 [Gossypium raimondii]|nr:hypothetical protein [Gossypium raimondii]